MGKRLRIGKRKQHRVQLWSLPPLDVKKIGQIHRGKILSMPSESYVASSLLAGKKPLEILPYLQTG